MQINIVKSKSLNIDHTDDGKPLKDCPDGVYQWCAGAYFIVYTFNGDADRGYKLVGFCENNRVIWNNQYPTTYFSKGRIVDASFTFDGTLNLP